MIVISDAVSTCNFTSWFMIWSVIYFRSREKFGQLVDNIRFDRYISVLFGGDRRQIDSRWPFTASHYTRSCTYDGTLCLNSCPHQCIWQTNTAIWCFNHTEVFTQVCRRFRSKVWRPTSGNSQEVILWLSDRPSCIYWSSDIKVQRCWNCDDGMPSMDGSNTQRPIGLSCRSPVSNWRATSTVFGWYGTWGPDNTICQISSPTFYTCKCPILQS